MDDRGNIPSFRNRLRDFRPFYRSFHDTPEQSGKTYFPILPGVYPHHAAACPSLLFIAYFGITRAFDINLSGFAASVIVFILWGTAEMGDLVRGALISIPKNQYESAEALGLSRRQMYRFIIIPQSLRRLLPPAINLFTRIIKTTSLVVLIGVVEMLKTGQQIIEANRYTAPDAALWIYAAIFFLYFLACYPLSRMAAYLEKKWTD